ncbi:MULTISPECIES: TIGR03086 family metal-binding protein [unclassified Nocardiopsis]|uniref:TIGR03086 family metal-binding protein n=1 Tax=Nocardiopsis TaxID=2013 RepID=UPI00387AB1EE
MERLIDLHGIALEEFDRRVRLIRMTDWALPTPCADWDVHDLVAHLTAEQLWVPPLLDGLTPEEVGDRFEGDILGEEPLAAWEVAAREARAAWLAPSARGRTVHLSFGDAPAQEYLWQMTFDLGVHAWDLARALNADENLDPDLTAELYGWARKRHLGPGSAFDAPVPVGEEAGVQERLLAFSGRAL